jgi:hypothetical protein
MKENELVNYLEDRYDEAADKQTKVRAFDLKVQYGAEMEVMHKAINLVEDEGTKKGIVNGLRKYKGKIARLLSDEKNVEMRAGLIYRLNYADEVIEVVRRLRKNDVNYI